MMKNIESEAANLWANQVTSKNFWANYEDLIAQAKQQQARKQPAVASFAPASVWTDMMNKYLAGVPSVVQCKTENEYNPGCLNAAKVIVTIGGILFTLIVLFIQPVLGLISTVIVILVLTLGNKTSIDAYYTFKFEYDYLNCQKKMVYSKQNEVVIELKVSYDTIGDVRRDVNNNLVIKSHKTLHWYDNTQVAHQKVIVPGHIRQQSEIYEFLLAVCQVNNKP